MNRRIKHIYYEIILPKIWKFWYIKIKHDTVSLARKLGVEFGEHGQILGDPFEIFGSEPWLIKCGDHVDVTQNVRFLNHEGGLWVARGIRKELETQDEFRPIKVGNNVLIGTDSIIMPGVVIGDNVIIAAKSVVSRNIPSNSIVGGSPAKEISKLDRFVEKIGNNTVPTKHMYSFEKKEYLEKLHPEWFDKN